MASTSSRQNTGSAQPNFILSPHQQDLLFAALNSNSAHNPSNTTNLQNSNGLGLSESPVQAPGSGTLNGTGFEESPFIDYDYDFDADGTGFDFDFSNISQDQMIGNLPGATSSDGDVNDIHEKRSHPDDEDENDEEGGGKRRESDERGAKKPGRKPLTSEPTSKRKAQNRAAQRAFRERKEKHLKDLETKVQDLEKASESANHENAMLRAKVERMAVELKEYRKKLSLTNNANKTTPTTTTLPPYMAGKGFGNSINNPNDVNFQFEFPQFGKLPGPPLTDASTSILNSNPAQASQQHRASTTSNGGSISPLDNSLQMNSGFGSFDNNAGLSNTNSTHGQVGNDMSEFSGLFSPSILNSVSKDFPFDFPATVNSNASRSSYDSARGQSSNGNTTYSSPSESSNSAVSQNGQNSSCGTTPEPSGQSPANKASDTLGTIGENLATSPSTGTGEKSFCEKLSMACGNSNNPIPRTMSESTVPSGLPFKTGLTPGFELNNFDWFPQQTDSHQFDPQLFGDYREPQNNILAGNGLFDDSFFNEAIDMNQFNSPLATEKSPQPAKKDLVSQIDDKLNAEEEIVPGEGNMLTCNNMWEKIQNCPSVKSGEIDMDSLCTQLQQKAKCSGEGPVIDEKDFKSVIKSMFPADQACPSAK